jgi:cellulose synthase/poly-beta-1,6-N-acetylglucosamine synthase-like glycosyltransferase
MPVAAVVLALLSLPALACALYLFVLALASTRRPAPPYGDPKLRFDLIVPAHNESAGIAETVKSLLALDYPADLRRVLVVADNCTDDTAACAGAAGATVLVRQDATLRGKGYALKYAFDRSLADDKADAVVVVDADTVVSPNLLHAYAARFDAGAKACQAEYGVRNPNASWRTRLMVIGLATFHGVRSLGRERLGVSCGLRGNGMAFANEVISVVPHEAFSLVEDLEYGIRLARAGYAVRYVDEARVLGEMVSSEKASRSQRRRWEGGRFAMMKTHGLPLLREALARRDGMLFDMAMDVLVPPLSYLFLTLAAGTAIAMFLAMAGVPGAALGAIPWTVALGMVILYVLRGVMLSNTGLRGLLDLAYAPVYILWKVALSASGSEKKQKEAEWVRTTREDEEP